MHWNLFNRSNQQTSPAGPGVRTKRGLKIRALGWIAVKAGQPKLLSHLHM